MNAKTCKKLRNTARTLTIGKPARALVPASARTNTLVNDPETTRGAYRWLKTVWR